MSCTLKYSPANFRCIRMSHWRHLEPILMQRTYLIFLTVYHAGLRQTLKPLHLLYKQALKIYVRRQHHRHILNKHKMLSFENMIMFSNVWLLKLFMELQSSRSSY